MADQFYFSVIVPVYNVQRELERCVKSLVHQESAQILLVDDGSTDESGRMCDRYAQEYGNVRALHKKNGGLSSARNYGAEHAEGEYLFFVDADDYVEAAMCSEIYKALKNRDLPDALTYNAVEEGTDTRHFLRRNVCRQPKDWSGHDYLLEKYKRRDMNVQAWMYAWRRDFWEEKGLCFKEGILHEDVEFTPRALLEVECLLELPDIFYHYIVRENSISTQKDKRRNIKDLFQILEGQVRLADGQADPELRRWMKNAALNSYLNAVYETRMYRKRYRDLLDKRFLFGKAATCWNWFRVLLCLLSIRLYCFVNDCYKRAGLL